MTTHHRSDILLQRAEIVAPPERRACDDHSFEMPTGLYGAAAALMFGFFVVMSIGFGAPQLIVPMAVIIIFTTMFFAVPILFVRQAPEDGSRALRWSELLERGIDTATGRTSGWEAAVLVLALPFFIFCWGLAIVAIAALV